MNSIQSDSLCWWPDGHHVVQNLTTAVSQGSVCALLGRNGAGKSSTLRLLLGLQEPTSGSCQMLGKPSHQLRGEDWQEIGYVTTDQDLYNWMRVDELINFTARLYKNWDRNLEHKLVSFFEIPLLRNVGTLSTGQRLKLALLLGTCFHPSLLIMDEPFAGLDPISREAVLDLILEITEQDRWTVLLASHDMAEVERIADRLLIMDGGTLIRDTDPERLQKEVRRIYINLKDSLIPELSADHFVDLVHSGNSLQFTHSCFNENTEAALAADFPDASIQISDLSLTQAFISLVQASPVKGARQ